MKAWKAESPTHRGWEIRHCASGFWLVALFSDSHFVCDAKWGTPDGATRSAIHRWEALMRLPADLGADAVAANKTAYLEAVRYNPKDPS